jgi:glycosyltransferase involved in cell wall biosynthesis
LVTIITVVFNGQLTIEETIISVLNLRYKNLEYIIIDGGSTDQTIEILSRYNGKIDYWISEKDRGIYDAMNKGIDLASGYWINFMNCGDRFADKDVLDIFSTNTYDADIIYGDAIVEYGHFQSVFKKVPLEKMWQRISFCHQASFTRSSLMKNWKFDVQYKLSSDFDFLYRAYLSNKKFTYSNTVICFFDFKAGATKSNALKSIQERRHIVLSRAFSFKKWVYYNFSIFYVYLALNLKNLLGDKITSCITRLLRA